MRRARPVSIAARAAVFARGAFPRARAVTHPVDISLGLCIGATPAQEAELIAREIRALLREGALPDGTPVAPTDIAILARDADAVYSAPPAHLRALRPTLRRRPAPLAHTSVGRAMLASLRLVREGWRREDLLLLLKSGFLALPPAIAFQIDLIARRHALREGKSAWLERWPDDATG